jgi:hypothetical protein
LVWLLFSAAIDIDLKSVAGRRKIGKRNKNYRSSITGSKSSTIDENVSNEDFII